MKEPEKIHYCDDQGKVIPTADELLGRVFHVSQSSGRRVPLTSDLRPAYLSGGGDYIFTEEEKVRIQAEAVAHTTLGRRRI